MSESEIGDLERTLHSAATAARSSKATQEKIGLTYVAERIVKVVGRDPTTRTYSIEVGGTPEEDPLGDVANNVVIGVRAARNVVFPVGLTAMALQNRSDYLLVARRDFGLGTLGLPKAKFSSISAVTSTGTLTRFNFQALETAYDEDIDENGNTMADLTNDRLICRWPGTYDIGMKGRFTAFAANARPIMEMRINGTGVGRTEAGLLSTAFAGSWVDQVELDPGDFIELFHASITANSTFGGADENTTALWMAWRP